MAIDELDAEDFGLRERGGDLDGEVGGSLRVDFWGCYRRLYSLAGIGGGFRDVIFVPLLR